MTNTSLDETAELTLDLGSKAGKVVAAEILTSGDVHDYNGFDRPDVIKPVEFKDVKVKGGKIVVKMPAMSIISIAVEI